MFSNLSKGSVLYGLDTKGEVKLFTATVDSVSIPRPRYVQNTFGQLPEMVVDIVANINGERKEYKEVPTNNVIADFGPDTFVLSDSRDSLTNYARSQLQRSKDIVNSADKHKSLIPQYERVLGELDPASASDNAVKELRGQVESMQSQMQEMLSLLKQKNNNPTI
jgi:ElaB/YqjD/DUF883 family membrane-anchored ribosome-binding protein